MNLQPNYAKHNIRCQLTTNYSIFFILHILHVNILILGMLDNHFYTVFITYGYCISNAKRGAVLREKRDDKCYQKFNSKSMSEK